MVKTSVFPFFPYAFRSSGSWMNYNIFRRLWIHSPRTATSSCFCQTFHPLYFILFLMSIDASFRERTARRIWRIIVDIVRSLFSFLSVFLSLANNRSFVLVSLVTITSSKVHGSRRSWGSKSSERERRAFRFRFRQSCQGHDYWWRALMTVVKEHWPLSSPLAALANASIMPGFSLIRESNNTIFIFARWIKLRSPPPSFLSAFQPASLYLPFPRCQGLSCITETNVFVHFFIACNVSSALREMFVFKIFEAFRVQSTSVQYVLNV